MTSTTRLAELEAIVQSASGVSWALETTSDGERVVRVRFADGSVETLRVTREREPAATPDVEFVASSRSDLGRLVACLRGEATLDAHELDEIERRCMRASAAPWRAFLEDGGAIGGSNVIWVSDDDLAPDLYIWHGTTLAPGADYELVAAARNEIPELSRWVRRLIESE